MQSIMHEAEIDRKGFYFLCFLGLTGLATEASFSNRIVQTHVGVH